MGEPVRSAGDPQAISSVRVYPGTDTDFTLFKDDGTTYGYEKGTGSVTSLHWNNQAQKLTHSGPAAWANKDADIIKVVTP